MKGIKRINDPRGINEEFYGIDGKRQVFVRLNTLGTSGPVCVDRLYDIMESDIKLKTYYSDIHDLPEPLMTGLCVLSMIDIGALVEGVGWRASRNTYWVVVDRNDITKQKVDNSNGEKQ